MPNWKTFLSDNSSLCQVRPCIPFEACLSALLADERVDDWTSPAVAADAPKTFARKTVRMRTFPDFLLVQLKK